MFVYKPFIILFPIWQLPPQTVQVRPSMIKVSKDPALSTFTTFNAIEVVNTRYVFTGYEVLYISLTVIVVTSSCFYHPVIHQKEQSYQETWLRCLAMEESLMNSFWRFCSTRWKSTKPSSPTNVLLLKVLNILKSLETYDVIHDGPSKKSIYLCSCPSLWRYG